MSDVPEGYTMSEVGVIPEDWEVKTLGEIADIDPDNLSNSTNPEYSFQYISLEDVDCGTLRNTTELLFKNAPSRARRKIRKDDILLSTVRPNLKSHLLLKKEISTWICSTGFSVVRSKDNIAHSGFIFNHLFSSVIDKQIETLITGSNYPAINSKDVKSLLIPLPPTIEEQQAIASALNDVDALITALEQLITKKRNIKQGAMQQLLTGKKRLPGFSGAWEVKKLGEIAEIATGNTPPTNDLNNYGNEFLFVSPADLGRSKYIIDSDKKLSKKGFNISRQFPKNSILFTCIGSTIGKSGIAPIVLTSNQQINAIFPNDSYSTDYVFYTLNHLAYRIKSLASEQAVPIINKSTFEATQTPFPPLPEQQAIAQILSDMDTEIESLEQKQAKYKAIKQGMMQELLTGKRRLA